MASNLTISSKVSFILFFLQYRLFQGSFTVTIMKNNATKFVSTVQRI